MTVEPLPRVTQGIVVLYILFNLSISGTFVVDPSMTDAQYRGGEMTPTREFLWFSVASLHLYVAATAGLVLRMRRAAERRWVLLANAGFYLWDALTQWGYWGAYVGVAPTDLHVNAGVSTATAALLGVAAWRDRSPP